VEGMINMIMKELLKQKELKYRILETVGPNETVFAAVKKLVKYNVGALPVCDEEGKLVGIITERDIVRKFVAQEGSSTSDTIVKDIMSTQVIIGTSDDDLNYAITAMKEKRIRHLPIMDKGKVIGMVSMRDLLGVELEECHLTVRNLNTYINYLESDLKSGK
jgi:CBS domain-containing protein